MTTVETPKPSGDRSLHLQCACTLLVAAGAAYVSYRHGREFALRFGADDTTAALWPLIVDGLLTTATIELWKTSHHHRSTGQWKAWLAFTLGIGLSLCANIASAPELNAFSLAVAACPPLALLLSVELLNQALKRRHAETTSDTGHEAVETTSPESHPPDSERTNASPEKPQTSAEMPALRTAVDNVPGHSAHSSDVVPETPHSTKEDRLHEQAHRLDTEHRNLYQRPISADTLRRQLHIGSTRARALTRHLRQQHQPTTMEMTGTG